MLTIQKHYIANIQPEDTISEISFHPSHPLLATVGWDRSIRFYGIEDSLIQKISLMSDEPLLCACFDQSGQSLFAGSVSGKVYKYDLTMNKLENYTLHESGIRSIRTHKNQLITGSWDKTIKIHDLNTGQVKNTFDIDNKLYCMDVKGDMIAYATSGNRIATINLNNLIRKTHSTRLTWQIRSIAASNDNISFAIGGIEGRIEHINTAVLYKNYTFKAHRSGLSAYSVNALAFHPNKSNIIASGGSDGFVHINDNESKIRVFSENFRNPITSTVFSNDGRFLAYAVGEDWSKGMPAEKVPTELRMMDVSRLSSN
ncbi:Protein RAE1 [Dictyocoela muelleri]|nr:Protein RAE1 [Dictyocoela muelleri]